MKAEIIRIGNSHGVRIPKPILEQCGLKGVIRMDVRDNVLVLAPEEDPRAGWSEAFEAMVKKGDDTPLLPEDQASEWDQEEWQW